MPEQSVGGMDIEAVARRLDAAWEQRQPIAPLSESMVLTADQAYAVQTRWTELRQARGERVVGRKIGLTSRAIQQQLGVNEPDYGSLWESRYFPAADGHVDVPADLFVQARVEGELAFLIGRSLREPGVTLQDVLAATEAVAAAIEIVDSRIARLAHQTGGYRGGQRIVWRIYAGTLEPRHAQRRSAHGRYAAAPQR
jgi:2-keto-4-pentenoate hydratase